MEGDSAEARPNSRSPPSARIPGIRTAATTGNLFFGQEHAALGRALGGRFHGCGVGGSDLVVMMNLLKDGALDKRREDIRQEKIGNRAQLVSGGRVSCNLDAQRAQLLDETPDLGTAGTDFVSDLRSADHDGGVVHQQANDATEAHVSFLARGSAPWHAGTSWRRFGDAGIINSLVVGLQSSALVPCSTPASPIYQRIRFGRSDASPRRAAVNEQRNRQSDEEHDGQYAIDARG